MVLKYLDSKVKKSFLSELLADWLDNPICFGAFDDEKFLGFIEGSMETWNNRFRITNIWVDKAYRNKGIG